MLQLNNFRNLTFTTGQRFPLRVGVKFQFWIRVTDTISDFKTFSWLCLGDRYVFRMVLIWVPVTENCNTYQLTRLGPKSLVSDFDFNGTHIIFLSIAC